MEAKGSFSHVVVNEDSVIFSKTVYENTFSKTNTKNELFFKDIISIQYKPPGFAANGFIRFVHAGSNSNVADIYAAVNDGDSVVFQKKETAQFEAVAKYLSVKISELKKNTASTPQNGESVFDQLKKLGELRDAGVITETEFQEKKEVLMSKI